ncbi:MULTISPECIES: NAD-dependent epimerase/dehydratase family protein [Prochlorococcus]|uniref:NAD-dependent epimerase/dehydratase family protein n=1 Tax=Prochlorococcus TaxID=1218 RepID=UPI0007B33D4F|nr:MULTISPECIES: SDR family oxidoreductase [Prochlorococcus]KZR66197.1 dTDP-glucose 4,6-dehydratase [Prochlorococcus marinus str. MIT 1312]KZR83028.1 dTDP-glucose 4,6-dehydratase [Prochlorococcus marinus str. MIT 1327]NMO83961.1 SDR family oxidoreductase [Prochlorococcus sp. P1344]NMP05499.1 SDR family oxidoreductase [Prochlorococcus sp. P1361]NMP13077.1 SDR family oxidoreductase [Prochlorococcus sp.P1363]
MSEPQPITVLGAEGWIGSALVADLKRCNRSVVAIGRSQLQDWLDDKQPQGPVIYAIGLTADFRQRPHDTVQAHVSLLSKALQRKGIKQLLYLSSTRVYARSASTQEDAPLVCLSSDSSDLYNLSKLLGEALVLQDQRIGCRVVRLSNVVGPGQPSSTFIGSLLRDARLGALVTIQQSSDSVKDYVALTDVLRLLPLIAEKGRQRLYNLGGGCDVSHEQVAAWLRKQGAEVTFARQPHEEFAFPTLEIDRLSSEFGLNSKPFRQNLLIDH